MTSQTERRSIYVDQAALLCKKCHEFYGNAAWRDLCSKCCREETHRVRAKQIEEDFALAQRLQREEEAAYGGSQQEVQPEPSTTQLTKTEESKISQKLRNVPAVKKLLTLGKDVNVRETHPAPSTTINQQPVLGSDQATKQFIEFLKTRQKPGQDIFRQCHSFCCNMVFKKGLGAEELSESVQDFYQSLSDRLNNLYKGNSEQVEAIMDEVEKYIMLQLYEQSFCPGSADDGVKDLAIQKRIRALHWVTIQMLCAPLKEEIPAVSDSLDKAITAGVNAGGCRRHRGGLQTGSQGKAEVHHQVQQAHLRCNQAQQERGRLGRRLPTRPHLRGAEGQPTPAAVQHPVHNPLLQPYPPDEWRGRILLYKPVLCSSFHRETRCSVSEPDSRGIRVPHVRPGVPR
ncbi:RAB guanine nucleotide exchange factor (GEF) 1, like isoform X2 [Trichomycterus rosablanca]|uniref:RAB guanine nucleotide exchange factor (GEF) 1, like isoform X2 n=1 Tax=Trichomycterus rosablanca TaxID=2290929 RepID=UPI002F3609FD